MSYAASPLACTTTPQMHSRIVASVSASENIDAGAESPHRQ